MEIKYQIFISSTYEDLKEERQKIVLSILKHDHFPIGMEYFSAEDEEQWNIIKRTIDKSDVYVLVIGHRYGSLAKEKISFTEKEFNYALERKIQGKIKIICFIRDRNVSIEINKIEQDEASKKKLEKFISRVKNSKILVDFWDYKEKLLEVFSPAIVKTIKLLDSNSGKSPGWVKLDTISHQLHESDQLESMKKMMFDEAMLCKLVISDVEKYEFNNKGDCIIYRERTQLCLNDTNYSLTQFHSDSENDNCNVIALSDMDTTVALPHILYKTKGNSFGFFTLFPKKIRAGETIRYRSTIFVQNYVSDLITKNHSWVAFKPYALTTFRSKSGTFSFDNSKKFRNLKAYLVINDKIKSEIIPEIIDKRKVFSINYPAKAWSKGNSIKVHFKIVN